MRDNELIQIFLPVIKNGLTAAGFTTVVVKQANQPTQQGINTAPTVYFFKIGDHRYGFPYKSDTWDPEAKQMVHTEVEQYETSFQISALVLQSPATPNQYTASDLVNEVSAILQSDSAINTMKAQGVNILRITDIRNPYFSDDSDNFEASPSFDFVLTHKQTRISTVPVIDSVEYDIERV